ncbi:MAG: SDR family oxidoreductase [Planctomycetes bacterium]|nr:SDR family oxidoreductase [Planctomycetota bacterium]
MAGADQHAEAGARSQRVALVSGSVRGIGLAVARRLARSGARVHVTWRSSAARADALSAEFEGRVHRADLEDEDETRALIEAVLARDGRLDAFVHAVGEFSAGPLATTRAAEVRRLLENNVLSAVHAFDAAREPLRAARGAALFFGVAGLEGLRGRREAAAYAAAKSALLVLVRSWALEEAAHGVRVNLVSPGVIPHEGAAAQTHDEARAARIPLGFAGTPEDVAAAAEFLLSDDARHVTGVDLPVAGGWLL